MNKPLILLGAILLWGCGKNGVQPTDTGAAGAGGGGGGGGSADTSPVSCATVGCSAPPLCSVGCTATCGCCACAEGEHNGDLVCHGGCYEPSIADSGAAGTGGGGTDGSSSANCATVGCSAPPLCSVGCTATCGCCACAEGEHNGDLVCHGGCYVPSTADGSAATDAGDGGERS